jgi:hypothetical protein
MLQRTPPRSGDLAGKLIAMSEQLKAATGLDIVQAVRERVPAGHPTPAPVRVGRRVRKAGGGPRRLAQLTAATGVDIVQ